MLLSKTLLDAEQNTAVDRLYEHDETMLIAKMGAGKTIISLTAIEELMADGVLERIIVFAPVKVVKDVWRQEAAKWEHTQHLNVQLCAGTPAKRKKIVDEFENGILLLSLDLMIWFFTEYKTHNFDGLLIDELSKLKAGGKGFKKLRPHIKSFKWRVGMTGTPVAEDFEGLFYQVFALDAGERFGGRKDKYLSDYFFALDLDGYNWELKKQGAEQIIEKLKGLVYTVKDYRHTLPDLNESVVYVDLPDEVLALYKQFEKTFVLDIDPPQSAANRAVLSGKMQQIASGNIYVDDEWGNRLGVEILHNEKFKLCEKLVRDLGRPVVVCYWFNHELKELEKLFPDAVNLDEKNASVRWNNGEITILLVQPMSCSHGLQLQFGGCDLIFLTPIWSNDIKSQMVARLWRKGQTGAVNVTEIVARKTVDELIIDRVNGKKEFDEMFHNLIGE